MFSKKIILGSASPRRKQLMEHLGFQVEVRKKEIEEVYPEALNRYEVAAYLANLKAQPLLQTIQNGEVLLTSDTVVIHQDTILGKPKDKAEAIQILKSLSGDVHEVVSGVGLYSTSHKRVFSVQTKVFFKELTIEEIEYYVNQFKPYDKAGSYGIQEWIGMIGVQKIEGCFYNVMGLPINKVWEVLNTEF